MDALTKNKARNKAKNISIRGRNCEYCGNKKKLERHHTDYKKPLQIVILCKKCHEALHTGKIKLDIKESKNLIKDKTLILKNIPFPIHRELKIKSVEMGIPMSELVIMAVKEKLQK